MEQIFFRYIDYSQSLISSIKNKKEKDTLMVFSDYLLKRAFSENLKISLWERPQELLKIEEFYTKLFTTDRVILKEAKRILTLFSSLSAETKKKLGMENYYDFISLADQFFKFYREKNSNLILEHKSLEEWQLIRIEKFALMKNEYDRFLEREGFIPSDWIKSIDNLNLSYVENFKKIIIIDQLEFTPLEVEVLKKISQTIKIEIVLQCKDGDFDEESFRLKKISLPSKDKVDISIFETDSEIENGINLLHEFEISRCEKNNDIFSPDPGNSTLNKILPKYFQNSVMKTLDSTEIYSFLKGSYELLATSQPELKKALSLSVLESHISSRGFRLNYGIEDEDIKNFYKILKDDFKYFNSDTLESFSYSSFKAENISTILLNIYMDIVNISKFDRVSDFIAFIRERVNLESIIEKNFSDLLDKFFEALELAKSSEQLYGKSGLKNLFPDNPALGIFNLIIKYMNNIELKEIINQDSQYSGMVKPLHLAKERQGKITYLIGITDDVLPGKINHNSFFTEEQKLLNEIITVEDEKLLIKYRFFQGILSSKKNIIFFNSSESSGVKISPFLEELILEYGLNINTPYYHGDTTLEIIEKSLFSESCSFSSLLTDCSLPKENCDFKDGKLGIGAYAYDHLESCFYRFYLENIVGISPTSENYERNITSKFLGIYVHNALESIARKKYEDIVYRKDFSLERDFVKTILLETFAENRFKIPLHLNSYFKEILIESIMKNILDFYLTLEKTFSERGLTRFQAEKSSSERKPIFFTENLQITLNGRVDLLIESKTANCIIDYKTGKKNDKQLDFYSIMMYGSENAAQKAIFNVLTGKIEWYSSEKSLLTKERLSETLERFVSSQNYSLAEKKSSCIYCIYENICRRELYNE